MPGKYAIGLDFGTNSVRALVVDVKDGTELGEAVSDYQRGDHGVILDGSDPHLARQHPADYLAGIASSVITALEQAAKHTGFSPCDVIGIGVDTTGSTPCRSMRRGERWRCCRPTRIIRMRWRGCGRTTHRIRR